MVSIGVAVGSESDAPKYGVLSEGICCSVLVVKLRLTGRPPYCCSVRKETARRMADGWTMGGTKGNRSNFELEQASSQSPQGPTGDKIGGLGRQRRW